MIVFPAIDLKAGQVVRLAEGDMARATVYGDDPAAQATLFAEAGSQFLHVVDLDGAFAGEAVNREAVEGMSLSAARQVLQALSGRNIDSVSALDEARRARDTGAAQVTIAQGQLAVAQTYLDWCTIRAPIDGTILEKLVNPNELVTPQSFGGGRGPSTAGCMRYHHDYHTNMTSRRRCAFFQPVHPGASAPPMALLCAASHVVSLCVVRASRRTSL
jgi:multidrug efflux pump subunit AcrA (membrane-fusion protein)